MTDLRVHIVPVGYDYYSRVTEPLIKNQVDKVYFLRHEKGAIRGHDKFFVQIKKELKKLPSLISREVEIDIWDLYQCVEEFRKIIAKEKNENNRIFINVSTGTKITAMAGLLACMLWNETPYYVKLTNPIKKRVTNIPKVSVDKPQNLPVFELIKPDLKYLNICHQLKKHGNTMRKLKIINFLEEEGIIKQVDESVPFFSKNAKHSQLRAILEPMEKRWGLISVESRGRRSEVTLTKTGEKALQIFGIDG